MKEYATAKERAMRGKPYAGNPHVRFDEGAGAPTRSGRSALLYKLVIVVVALSAMVQCLCVGCLSVTGSNEKVCLVGDQAYFVAKYAYDVMDRVTNIAWRTTGGAALGAALCMRSKSVNGHANQCCYDKCGKLITHGSGSGSVDYAPGEFATFFEHREKDMFPADWAKKLDGGIWGGCSEAYLLRRPEKGAEKCPRNP